MSAPAAKIRQFKFQWKLVQSLSCFHISVCHTILLFNTTTVFTVHSQATSVDGIDDALPWVNLTYFPFTYFFFFCCLKMALAERILPSHLISRGKSPGAADLRNMHISCRKPTLLAGIRQTPTLKYQSWMSYPVFFARLPKGHHCLNWHRILASDVNVLQNHPLWT